MRVCVRVFIGFGPGLDSMSPTRSRCLLAMLRGRTAGFPKNWADTICSFPDCGTPTTSRLYLFGALLLNHHKYRIRSHYIQMLNSLVRHTMLN